MRTSTAPFDLAFFLEPEHLLLYIVWIFFGFHDAQEEKDVDHVCAKLPQPALKSSPDVLPRPDGVVGACCEDHVLTDCRREGAVCTDHLKVDAEGEQIVDAGVDRQVNTLLAGPIAGGKAKAEDL
jgi:hypothetical protein